MNLTNSALTIWIIFTGVLVFIPISIGVLLVRSADARKKGTQKVVSASSCELLIPVKGSFPHQETILSSLLTQTHPNYHVLFILEDKTDPAYVVIEKLCAGHQHARMVFSGPTIACGQKNHNLIAGINHLRPETEIIVFCDATNKADPDWLLQFTWPLESCKTLVITTFRDFNPVPETLGGVCQAMYASLVLLLMRIRPFPWGGATAICCKTLRKSKVIEAWSRTVNDDLILGNLLYRSGIPIMVDSSNRLESPLQNQSVSGFLSYLDRQIVFPKFTNPCIWVLSLVIHLNGTAAGVVALVVASIFFPAGLVGASLGWVSCAFLVSGAVASLMLRSLNPYGISIRNWLLSLFPCVLLVGFILFRSVFRKGITWHGRSYLVGRGGAVLSISPGHSVAPEVTPTGNGQKKVTIPDWFDPSLKGELARMASKKKDAGYFLDVGVYTVLDFFSSAAWKRLRKYGWEELEELIRKDCEEIEKSGFSPDVIVGIKSGGAFLAKFVAQCLGVKDVDYVSTEHWAPVLGKHCDCFFP